MNLSIQTLSLFFLLGVSHIVKAQVVTGACAKLVLPVPPTDVKKTFIRSGFGEFGAPRRGGESKHQGVDLTHNMNDASPDATAVFALSNGHIAYSRVNGSATSGYGNVVVIDHGNGCYAMYAHLAGKPFTPTTAGGNLSVTLGDPVKAGQVLGYFVDIKADTSSTGNAVSTDPAAREQVHFQLIEAPPGRHDNGTGSLKNTILRGDAAVIDPTPLLKTMGYTKK